MGSSSYKSESAKKKYSQLQHQLAMCVVRKKRRRPEIMFSLNVKSHTKYVCVALNGLVLLRCFIRICVLIYLLIAIYL
ncbi:hypothetical protein ACS0TY_025345 [Phlomoides rotata]